MKSAFFKKTAQLLVTMLLVTALVPVLAFADTASSDAAESVTTTDSVYTDVNTTTTNSVYTDVYSFEDLQDHWAKSDVQYLVSKKIINGVSETSFAPERDITRAEFAALVVRALGLTDAGAASASFTDVASDAWYASTVTAATYAGIINGYDDNTFRPDAKITREELAAIVIRALDHADVATNISNPEDVLKKYTDSGNISWAQKELAAAINIGLISGMTEDTLAPEAQATRAQAAVVLKRVLGILSLIK
ncbi:S-layer homology domain-containing protein [Paenibacillus rigui]|uniref:S-layer homology domain-containing protein n=1 Tax=Paenibacillus rigui TaxID=554312 RepID=UPI0015C6718D|nr:S-layer homology domain-containing protein [Paenibacillus rigui]